MTDTQAGLTTTRGGLRDGWWQRTSESKLDVRGIP